jgi:hypothetical protein
MTKIFVPRSYERMEKQSFRVGTTAIAMGKPVQMNSAGKLDVSGNYTNGDLSIGIIDHMDDYVALNGTQNIKAGDPANIVLFGKTIRGISGGTFNAGVFVKYSSTGTLVTEATATTKTVNTVGISLKASTAAAQEIDFLLVR